MMQAPDPLPGPAGDGDRGTPERDRLAVDAQGFIWILGPDNRHYRTPYPSDFLDAVKAHRPPGYIYDELLRSEYPPYILRRIEFLFKQLALPKDVSILDFGAGGGASSACLVKLGYRNITALDCSTQEELYVRRLRCLGMDMPVYIQRDLFTYRPDRLFDVILCWGVYEHLVPGARSDYTDYLFRLLKDGGHFVVGETPTRYFPRNSHIGWLCDWLPVKTSLWVFKEMHGMRGLGNERIFASGEFARGVTIGEITPRNADYGIVPLPVKDIMRLEILLPRSNASAHRIVRRLSYGVLCVLGKAVPAHYLLPQYNIVLRKKAATCRKTRNIS